MIYLDNAATTFPKPEIVYKEMDRINRECSVNAGRGLYKLANEANLIINDTKKLLRELINADVSTPLVFTPSVTIALNQIINGLELKKDANVYVSPYEHNAVARTLHHLTKHNSLQIKQLPINGDTLELDIYKIKFEFAKNHPSAIFCTHISNVIGYILPVEEIFSEGKKYGSINILDTAQSLGLMEVNSKKINADIIAFAGHKSLYGPFGIGGFANITGIKLKEYITGGTGSNSLNLDMPDDLESKYEPASHNIIAIAGLRAALKDLFFKMLPQSIGGAVTKVTEGADCYRQSVTMQSRIFQKEKALTDYLIDSLSKIKGIKLFLPSNRDKHIGIVSFVLKDFKSEDVGMILDEDFGIAVRTGYHCAPFIHEYLSDKDSLGTVRVSLGQFNIEADIDVLVKALKSLTE